MGQQRQLFVCMIWHHFGYYNGGDTASLAFTFKTMIIRLGCGAWILLKTQEEMSCSGISCRAQAVGAHEQQSELRFALEQYM